MSATDSQSTQKMQKLLNILSTLTAPECHVDVGELAKILQAIHFHVKSSGEVAPSLAEECGGADATAGGVRITITCLKSRQQVVLQRGADIGCTCQAVDDERGSWEVTAMTSGSRHSLVEATSGAYPPLEADVAATVRLFMAFVAAFTTGRMQVPPAAASTSMTAPTPRLTDRRLQMPRLSLGATERRQETFAARYRSLDTLIDKDSTPVYTALPKPGALLKPASQTIITTDVTKAKSESSLLPPAPAEKILSPSRQVPAEASSDLLNCLLCLQDNLAAQTRNLNRAIVLCRNDGVVENLEVKTQIEAKLSPKTKARCVGNIKPTVSVRPTTPTAPAPKTKKVPVSRKYAHIKSTIPKPAAKH